MVEVIAHGGYRDATVDRVLEQAHVSWDAFAREFEDLDACFLATLDAAIECAWIRADSAIRALGTPASAEATFDATLDALLGSIAANPELTRLCLVESAALGAKAVERREAGFQRFIGLIGPRPASGGDDSMPALAAEMVAGGIYEVLQHKARAGELEAIPALATELRELWLPVLRASAGRN